MSPDDLERQLRQLPREAWDRPAPPPPPWPAEQEVGRGRRGLFLRPVAAGLAALALLGAGTGAGLLLGGGDSDSGEPGGAPVRVRLNPVGGRGAGATRVARLQPRPGGRAAVELTGLRPSRAGEFYELWLLGEGGELVSLGSVRVPESASAELDLELPVDPGRFRYLDLSRKPADGDASHSKISVLRGPAA